MNSIFTIFLLVIIISCLVYLIINKNENENFLDNTICSDKINLAKTKAIKKYNDKYKSKYKSIEIDRYFRNLNDNSKARLEIIELIEIFRPVSSHSAILFQNILYCYKQYTIKKLYNYFKDKFITVLTPMFQQIDDINNLKNANNLTKTNIDKIKSDLETDNFGKITSIGEIISELNENDINTQLYHYKITYNQIYNLIKGGEVNNLPKFNWTNLRKNYIDDLTQIYTIIDYNHSITQNNDTSNMNAEELKKYHEKEFNATLKKSKETSLPKPIDILDGYKNKIQDMLINIHLKPVLDILNSIGFQTKADTKLKLIEINKFTKFIDNIKEEISEVNGAQDIIEEFNNDLINYMEYYKN
jgi:hypothetical protein